MELLAVLLGLILTGCQRDSHFSQISASIQPGADRVDAVPTDSEYPRLEERFSLAEKRDKKVDLLFVVDNSGSMAEEQAALAEGFGAIAETYFQDPYLDVCIKIITTDRYLGRLGPVGYARERTVVGTGGECTRPAGSENWSRSERAAHIAAFIEDFKNKVKVGIRGSDVELPGKSLTTFLSSMDVSSANSFLRKDAALGIGFFTDENNYSAESGVDPSLNDLSSRLIQDSIEQVASQFAVVSMLSSQTQSVARNLAELVEAVGGDSLVGNVDSPAIEYSRQFEKILGALVARAGAIQVEHPIYEPGLPGEVRFAELTIHHSNGSEETLRFQDDYEVVLPNEFRLKPQILAGAQAGDWLRILYRQAD